MSAGRPLDNSELICALWVDEERIFFIPFDDHLSTYNGNSAFRIELDGVKEDPVLLFQDPFRKR